MDQDTVNSAAGIHLLDRTASVESVVSIDLPLLTGSVRGHKVDVVGSDRLVHLVAVGRELMFSDSIASMIRC